MSTLDNLRKSAKRWLQAIRSGDPRALQRLRRAYPNAPATPTLRDVQHALAREQGAKSWTVLKARVLAQSRAVLDDQLVDTFVTSATWDHHVHGKGDHRMHDRAAQRLLAQHQELARQSLYTAIVCGEVDEVARIVAERAEAARESGGSRGWTPILYLAFIRFTHPKTIANALGMARLLLDAGANPNDFYRAGDVPYSVLTGIAGEGEQDAPRQPYAAELFELLLERGAAPFDQQVLYNTHFSGDLLWWLEIVYNHTIGDAAWRDPEWRMFDMGPYGTGARFLLEGAIKKNDLRLAEWVLQRGANPNSAPARDRRFPKRSLYELALLSGNSAMAELFERHGAEVTQPELDDRERLVQALLRGDREEVRALPRNAEVMFEMAKRDRPDAIALLVENGMSVDVADSHNMRALHHAASANALNAAKYLIDHGAEIDPRETTYGGTPLGWASYGDHPAMVDFLSRYSRNLWTLCWRGCVERVAEILRDEPDLARQTNDDGVTPLWWLPDDEAKALQIVELLLAAGADPAARSKNGKTAADWAQRRGMTAVAARLGVFGEERPAVVERYEELAADILKAHESGDPASMQRVQEHFRRAFTWEELRSAMSRRLELIAGTNFLDPDGARLLVARDAGFRDWSEFTAALARDPSAAQSTAEWERAIAEQRIEAVRGTVRVTDAVLERIAALPFVTSLNLEGCRYVTDDGLRHLGRMPQLRALNLTGCSITDDGLRVLRDLPELRAFTINHHPITDAGAAHLEACALLERVSLMGTATGDGAIAALAGKPHVRFFQAGDGVTDAGLARFQELPRFAAWQGGELEYGLLSPHAGPTFLWLNPGAPFTDLAPLARLEGLFALSLFGTSAPRDLKPLAALPNLGWLGCTGALCDDAAMEQIAALPRLRMLMCQDTEASDAGFAALSHSTSIEHIWGRRTRGLTSPGFVALATMPSLRGLAVSCMNVDDDALSLLPRFPALRELVPMQVSDDGFRHVGRCEKLEHLWCMDCQDTGDAATQHIASLHLRTYYAGHTRITNRSLEILGRMSTLERVELWNCPSVTDAGLPFLAKLPRLRDVVLENNAGLTRDGAAVFPPGVRVEYAL